MALMPGGIGRRGAVLGQVTRLSQTESVRLDPDRLEELFMRLGHRAAEDVVSRALQELSARLGQLDGLHRRGETGEMRKCARSMGAIADQLGMPALARVARDVAVCSEGGDAVALAATLARLHRVGEVSLARIWDLPAG